MRKFADKEQAIKQVNGSNTEATLILCGYSGERANNIWEEFKYVQLTAFYPKDSQMTADTSRFKVPLYHEFMRKEGKECVEDMQRCFHVSQASVIGLPLNMWDLISI